MGEVQTFGGAGRSPSAEPHLTPPQPGRATRPRSPCALRTPSMTAIEIHGTAAGFVAEVVGVLSSGRDGGVLHQTPAFDDPDFAQAAGQQARERVAAGRITVAISQSLVDVLPYFAPRDLDRPAVLSGPGPGAFVMLPCPGHGLVLGEGRQAPQIPNPPLVNPVNAPLPLTSELLQRASWRLERSRIGPRQGSTCKYDSLDVLADYSPIGRGGVGARMSVAG
jgi:hypothetical protein